MPPQPSLEHNVESGRPNAAEILSRAKAADDAGKTSLLKTECLNDPLGFLMCIPCVRSESDRLGTMVFVCGPRAMVRSVCAAAQSCGVLVHAELFEM